jgi:hypothetical protein
VATHLSVFVENRPGKIESITAALAEAGVNLLGITIASRGEFGVVKILPSDIRAATRALTDGGFTFSPRRIVVAMIPDTPGSLHDVLHALAKRSINVDDCYAFVLGAGDKAAAVLEIEAIEEAEGLLASMGIRVLSDDEIHTLSP